jgi:superoxide reductase
MRELVLKKCLKCGALIKVITDCTCEECGIKCCGENMKLVKPNSVDAAVEKHIPTYEINEDSLVVTVNHVMDEDHYIEWIAFINEKREEYVYFKPGDECKAIFKFDKGTLYSYCNKHSLWTSDIK